MPVSIQWRLERCLLWVSSGTGVTPAPCPFFPSKQTFASVSGTPLSANTECGPAPQMVTTHSRARRLVRCLMLRRRPFDKASGKMMPTHQSLSHCHRSHHFVLTGARVFVCHGQQFANLIHDVVFSHGSPHLHVFSRQRATHRLKKPFLLGIYRPFAVFRTKATICNGFVCVDLAGHFQFNPVCFPRTQRNPPFQVSPRQPR
jgi:hypothetical protein